MQNQRQTDISPALLKAIKTELTSFHRAVQRDRRAAEKARLIKPAKGRLSLEEMLQRQAETKKAKEDVHNKKAELLRKALQQTGNYCIAYRHSSTVYVSNLLHCPVRKGPAAPQMICYDTFFVHHSGC